VTMLRTSCPDTGGWAAAGLFLNAFTRRDFAALSSCFDPAVRFRALVPPGLVTTVGAADTARQFERWFGGADVFDVVDASIGQIGDRLYLRWRVRMRAPNNPEAARVVEQHAFATASERIHALDLLCSGFQTEDPTLERTETKR
jgi:SnoaL-like domain